MLTPAQRATLRLERVDGEVGVAIAWRELTDVGALVADPALRLIRTLPSGPLPADSLVTARFTVEFDRAALESGCYEVVEQVPSGLVPVEKFPAAVGPRVITPMAIVGQRVTFCVPYDTSARGDRGPFSLAYVARVVSTGAFAWEPAVMQLPGVPDAVAVTEGSTTRIGN